MATEDPKQGCRLSWDPAAADRPPAMYQKGMDLSFPSSEELGQQHCIILNPATTEQLSHVAGETFPIIIRLEAVTEEGVHAGHSLEELPPGGPLPNWAQAQTTYAKLKKDEEGHWIMRVLKQKIWVNSTSYELQEIYGMESNRSTPSTAAPQEDVDGRECVICMTNVRDTMALPCRHMCMCYECAQALKTQTNKCPICRMEISELMHIKIQQQQVPGAVASAGSGGPVEGVLSSNGSKGSSSSQAHSEVHHS